MDTISDDTDPGSDPAVLSQLEELRLRVAAQDRLIEAILEENADIHQLRQQNHDLQLFVDRLLSLPGVQPALRLRRRVLGRPEPD